MRAALVETVRCTDGGAPVTSIEVRTDPLLAPDMGHTDVPLVIGSPARDGECDRVAHLSSDRQALVALVDNRDAFVIVG